MNQTLSLRSRLLIAFTGISLILPLACLISFLALREISRGADHISTVNLVGSSTLGDLLAKGRALQANVYRLSIPGLNDATRKETLQQIEDLISDSERLDLMFKSGNLSEAEQKLLERKDTEWQELKPVLTSIMELGKFSDQSHYDQLLDRITEGFDRQVEAYQSITEQLFTYQNDDGYKWAGIVKQTMKLSIMILLGMAICGFLVSALVGHLVSRRLAKQLQDLTTKLVSGADEMSTSAKEVSEASLQLAEGSQLQATSLQETVAAVDQINAILTANLNGLVQSQAAADASRQAASDGKISVEKMIQAIHAISESNRRVATEIEKNNNQIADIMTMIAEIDSKTKVINDIVFQTKLLSFNASVEAARAGEHGQGFSVVAQEIGKLAQLSGDAAKEISNLLSEKTREVAGIIHQTRKNMEVILADGQSKMELGNKITRACGEALEKIVSSTDIVKQKTDEIALTSNEQTLGIKEIGKAINELDSSTQKNVGVSQDCARVSNQLNNLSTNLDQMVVNLANLVSGTKNQSKNKILPYASADDSAHFQGPEDRNSTWDQRTPRAS